MAVNADQRHDFGHPVGVSRDVKLLETTSGFISSGRRGFLVNQNQLLLRVFVTEIS